VGGIVAGVGSAAGVVVVVGVLHFAAPVELGLCCLLLLLLLLLLSRCAVLASHIADRVVLYDEVTFQVSSPRLSAFGAVDPCTSPGRQQIVGEFQGE